MERETLCAWALEAGFAQAGFCSTEGFEASFRQVQAQPALAERRQLRFFPEEEIPWARSLMVLLWPYRPAALAKDGEAFVDSYYAASNAAYHAARALESRLLAAGIRARANVTYPARTAAIRAGLGLIGHHGLLISRRFGTRVVILLMATELPSPKADCEPGEETCLRCGRCAAACPSGAIDELGMRHPERCMRNYMMEGIAVPEEMRTRMGMRLLGCDICQRVCPMQPRMEEMPGGRFLLDDFVTADEGVFSQSVRRLAEEIGRNAARPQRVRAQAALLSGNRMRVSDLPVLRVWAESPFDAVAEHAAWAIRRIEEARDREAQR